jgi:tetraacyldisaccharide 4'-kinase
VGEQIRLHPGARATRADAIAFELRASELVSVEHGVTMVGHAPSLYRIVCRVIRLAVQQALERGIAPSPPLTLLSRLWEARARVTKRLVVRKPVLCVSGATLGGSHRTPLAIACARFLSDEGLRVALVGHAYRARPPREARRVLVDDDARLVGDEAIECARNGVMTFVARSRQDAIDAAELEADALVLDGPLQLESQATLSLLSVDRDAPWGSGMTPPLGNLRASRAALERAADAIAFCEPRSRGVLVGDELIEWSALPKRIGVTTGIARPERVLDLLRRNGVAPIHVLYSADHTRVRFDDTPVDLWLTTSKDAARERIPRKNVGVIDYYLDLPNEIAALLRSRFSFRF